MLDTIEIEPAMVAGCASSSARDRPTAMDAPPAYRGGREELLRAPRAPRYEVILSEPSTVGERRGDIFTRVLSRHQAYLAPGGLFVQWIQHYEFDDRLLASISAQMAENFSDFEVYECSLGAC